MAQSAAFRKSRAYEPPVGEGRLRWLVRLLLALGALAALGGLLARASVTLCFLAVGGVIGGVALLLWPEVALYGLAFAVPFGSLVEREVGGIAIGPSELLLTTMVGAWLLRLAALRRVRMLRSWPLAGLGVYLATVVIALWPAQAMAPALKELAKWVEALLLVLFVSSELGSKQMRALIVALCLAGIGEGLLGIYQFIRQVGPPGFILLGRYMRAYGTFEQPNPYGGYLGLLLPLGYGLVLAGGGEALRAWRARRRGPAMLWLLALGASGVMAAGLIMSWSRGALLGLGAGAVLVVLALGKRVWVGLGIAVLLVALAGLGPTGALPSGLVERVGDAFQYVGTQDLAEAEINDANFAIIERAAHWVAAWRMFSERPWLGEGAGQYATVYPRVALPRWQDPLGHAHNYYLNVLAEGGLLGLAGYLTFLLAALAYTFRQAWRARGWRKGVVLGALGMLGHLAAHSAFDNLYVHGMYLLVAILIGMVVSLGKGRAEERRIVAGPEIEIMPDRYTEGE